MYLNLDRNFNPYKGEEMSFESFIFPGGEGHIKISGSPSSTVTITHRIKSFSDLVMVMLATDALRRMGTEIINLMLPYFPAARQDRVMVKGEPLTVKILADMINSLNLNRVTVFDPHSEVTPALLNNCEVIYNYDFIGRAIEEIGQDLLLTAPDGGALKKIYKVSEALGGIEVLECSKSRDVKTGHLKGFRVSADDLQGRHCIIVDDICDGGGTFMGLAEALKQKNAGDLYLAVSHGIFSKGFDDLCKHFKGIYTTNSFRDIDDTRIKQIKLEL
jgi:ribose-phosphate pyrophosphokinase